MKNKAFWRIILQILTALITALGTAVGVSACVNNTPLLTYIG